MDKKQAKIEKGQKADQISVYADLAISAPRKFNAGESNPPAVSELIEKIVLVRASLLDRLANDTKRSAPETDLRHASLAQVQSSDSKLIEVHKSVLRKLER